MDKVLCKNCSNLYNKNSNKCFIRNRGITLLAFQNEEYKHKTSYSDEDYKHEQAVHGDPLSRFSKEDIEKANFFLDRSEKVTTVLSNKYEVYGYLSELNYDNTCKLYIPTFRERMKLFLGKYFKFKK